MIIELDFGKLEFYDTYLISTIYEGVTVDQEKNNILLDIILKYYKKKPYVYISNRIYSYAVDPSIYVICSQFETLLGFGVVSTEEIKRRNTELEKMFYQKKFEVFDSLDVAVNWAKHYVEITKSNLVK